MVKRSDGARVWVWTGLVAAASLASIVVYRAAAVVENHAGMLVSGLNDAASPIEDVIFEDNLVVDTVTGRAYLEEGNLNNIVNRGLVTDPALLPSPLPSIDDDPGPTDTAVLRTRDTSYLDQSVRRGLYRILVRVAPDGRGFEQRFEYVVAGSPTDVDAWLTDISSMDVVHRSNLNGRDYLAIRNGAAIQIPDALSPIDFVALRAGDRDGSLSELWRQLES